MRKSIAKLLTILSLFSAAVFSAAAQESAKGVGGTVTDESGLPVPGAVVTLLSTKDYAVTDGNGHYALPHAVKGNIVECSCLGMENAKAVVDGPVLDIRMSASKYVLDESSVVSIGYGAVKKKDLTGAVASVSGEQLSSFATSSVSEALQGRLAGVEVRSVTNEPGSTVSIRVRGTNSINGGNDPLWIIDGFPGMAAMLNTADIESVEVLKDASATAIYGSRGSNGVIIVTTKKGTEGKTSVDYNGSVGVGFVANKLDLLDAAEYMQYQNILQKKSVFSQDEIDAAGKGTDWQDLIYKPAVTNDHSVLVKAGTKTTKIAVGGSILDQQGIIPNSSYTKMSMRTSITHAISSTLDLTAGLIYTRTHHNKQSGIVSQILKATPTLPAYQEDGSYTSLRDYYTFSPSGLKNPMALVNEKEYKWVSNRTMANAALTWKPFKGFSIRGAFNANLSNSRQDDYVSTKMPDSLGEISISTGEAHDITGEVTANYSTKINGHSISAMIGSTYEESVSRSTAMSGSDLTSDVAKTYGIASAGKFGTPSAGYAKWVMLSFLGRVNYSYKDRYLATVNFRADGSSRYSKGHKWGAFPSMALAWRISEEEFMKNVSIINNFKLRAGWGMTGNTAISPYATLDLLTPEKTVFNKELYTIYHPSSAYRFGLVWETTEQWNVGVDYGMWRDRLRLTADFYNKNTYNLLNTVELPGSSGYTNGTKNIGTMLNYGFEMQLDGRAVETKDFKWDIGCNISLNRNRVVELPDHEDVYGTKRSITIINDYVNILREGQPIGVFYGYVEDGYDDKGRIKYVDTDLSGKIDEKDKQIIGDPNPKMTYGLSTTLKWKWFTLSAYFQGSVGNDIYSLSMASLCYNYAGSKGINTMKAVLNDHWSEDNPNAQFPALTPAATASLKMSDRFVYDGSYFRMKNLELSYDIPMEKVKWINRLNIYVSGQNLFTITKYPFYDPDVNTYGGSSSVSQGIDNFSYPSTRSYTFGVRVNF